MSYQVSGELSIGPFPMDELGSGDGGIVEAISLKGKEKLRNLRSEVEKERLKKELQNAKEIEQAILKYFKIDTYLGIEMMPRERERTDFDVVFPMGEVQLGELSNLFRSLFALYFLRNPSLNKNITNSWVLEKKSLVIQFGVNHDGSSYYIRNIQVVDIVKDESEDENDAKK